MYDHNTCLNYIQNCEKDYLENLIALCPDGVIAIDRAGTVTIFNRAAEVLTGRSALDVVGKMNIADVYPSRQTAKVIKKQIYSENYGGPGCLKDFDVEIKTIDGRQIPIRLSAVLIYQDEEEIGSVGFFHDLTERKKMEEKLRFLSITDSLTGLYNQRYFHVCIAREMDRSERYDRPFSIICFDLDHFKQCNDILGHLEGDNVLRMIGKLLTEIIRSSDIAFRYGGDEFFILLPETLLDNAKTTGEKIRNAFNSRWPYEMKDIKGKIEQVTLSIGVAQTTQGESSASLIKRTDLAMYEAKNKGGDCIVVAAREIGVRS